MNTSNSASQRAPLQRIPKGPPAKQVYAQWCREGLKNAILIEDYVAITATDLLMAIGRAKCNGDITLKSFMNDGPVINIKHFDKEVSHTPISLA